RRGRHARSGSLGGRRTYRMASRTRRHDPRRRRTLRRRRPGTPGRRTGPPAAHVRGHRQGSTPMTLAVDQGSEAREALARLRAEVAKVVVGQDAIVSGLVIALLCRGHGLLEGVPGGAKTLLVRTLGTALAPSTKRLQFTPD